MTKLRSKSAAVLTVRDAPAMTRKGRSAIARWLRDRADDIESVGDQLSGTFVARYMYAAGRSKRCRKAAR